MAIGPIISEKPGTKSAKQRAQEAAIGRAQRTNNLANAPQQTRTAGTRSHAESLGVLRPQTVAPPANTPDDWGMTPIEGGGWGGGPVPSIGDYEANDSILTAALAALDRAMKDYESQATADTENYERDYSQGLNNLGWRDPDDGIEGNFGWDWNDVLTSSGRAYQNQNNDFASRGMLQSQGYLDAQAMLDRSLNDQRTAMETGRTDFLSDLGRKKTEFQNQDTLARQQARAEAAARRAAEYGIV